MDIQKIIETVIKVIMDCLEDCFQTMTIAAGKRLVEVLAVCFSFLIFSVIMKFLEIPVFITWQEALVACIFMCVIVGMDYANKSSIDKVRSRFAKLKERGSGNEQ